MWWTKQNRKRRCRNVDVFNRKSAGIEIWNLLQNNKLSAGDFCRRVLLHRFPSTPSGYLIISNWWRHNSASRDVQENGLPLVDDSWLFRHHHHHHPSFFEGSNSDNWGCLAPLFRPIKCLINYLAKGVKRRGRVGALSCSYLSKHPSSSSSSSRTLPRPCYTAKKLAEVSRDHPGQRVSTASIISPKLGREGRRIRGGLVSPTCETTLFLLQRVWVKRVWREWVFCRK